ncbi:MAG TPA: glycosyltransferase family 4 protein [Ignavibacteria bacterium]
MERYNKLLNTVVLFENAFPVGYASANRLLSIAKGINELGHRMKVYCIRPSDYKPQIINKDVQGVSDGVEYVYPANTTIWPDGIIKRYRIYLKGIILTWKALIKENNNNRIHVVFSYSYNVYSNLIFWVFCKIYKIKFIYLIDEYPDSVLYPKKFGPIFKWCELNYFLKVFDIIFAMTTPLKEFYTKLKGKNAKIEIIPMTVQPQRFENYSGESPSEKPYFAYSGYIGDNKDGLDILIKAFSIFAKKYDNILLYMIGYSRIKAHHDSLMELAKVNDIADRIVFTGSVHRDEIPRYLCNAIGLVLARPDNIRAKGGFPTKVGEYLATGKPIVVTKVGEIPSYLKDNVNAFLAEPGSVESFASKMIELIEYPIKANQIGLRGKKLTENVFNYKVQAQNIIDFILCSYNYY